MSVEENKKSAYRCFEEVWNKRDLSVIPEVIAPNYVGNNPEANYNGLDGFERLVKVYNTAVPDMHWTVEDIFGEGDKLAIRIPLLFSLIDTLMVSVLNQLPTTHRLKNRLAGLQWSTSLLPLCQATPETCQDCRTDAVGVLCE